MLFVSSFVCLVSAVLAFLSRLLMALFLVGVFFVFLLFFFFSSRRRHTRSTRDWSSDVCSSDLISPDEGLEQGGAIRNAEVFQLQLDQAAHLLLVAILEAMQLREWHTGGNHTQIGRASCRERV